MTRPGTSFVRARAARAAVVLALFAGVATLLLPAPLVARQGAAPSAPVNPQTPTPPAPDAAPGQATPGSADGIEVRDRRPIRPIVRVGQNLTIEAGDEASEVVVIAGSVTIEGHVRRDAVVVGGTVRLGPNARVGGSLVSIGTRTEIAPGAAVDRDLVVIGSPLTAPGSFAPGGEQVVIGVDGVGSILQGVWPWLTQGLLFGRIIVPSLGWMWWLVAVGAFLYLVVGLILERAVRGCVQPLVSKPLSTFLAGLLVFLLTGPAMFILAISIVGIIVIPFAVCALVVAGLIGKIAVARAIGGSLVAEEEAGSRLQAARSIVLGLAVLVVAYMIPVIGLVTFLLVGVFGLGAAWLALFAGLRRENPARPKPPRPLPPVPAAPAAHEGSAAPVAPDAGAPALAFTADPAAGTSSFDHAPSLVGAVAAAGGAAAADPASLLAMPKASFLERAAAFALDVVLVAMTFSVLNLDMNGPRAFFLMLLIYHVAFWTMKGTTVGGIICNLRVIRTDGEPVTFGEATIRGLSSTLSLAVLGLGALWILRDPERQAWHDTFAGTYVVRVPKNWRG